MRDVGAVGGLALVSFLPFLSPLLSGQTFFFRDLSVHYIPLRLFALDGLRGGQVHLWNPLNHEGVPLSLPAVGYLLDLLQLLRPDPNGVSLLLALHVPLAAGAFFGAARGLGLGRAAAIGGSLVYALGGFCLSSLNLYVYLQAMAWAPLVVLGVERAGRPGGPLAWPAALVALSLTTTGVEIAGQAILWGFLLVRPLRRIGRSALSVALGAGLAAPVLLLLHAQVPGSTRDGGFATDVVLAQSVHPISLLQVVVGNLHGNLANLANEWWGQNFFPRGFPYVLSLYLGCLALSCAFVSLATDVRWKGRVILATAVSLLLALGRFIGWEPVVDLLAPPLRAFRFPVKAFFGVHLGCALLVAAGLGALVTARTARPWRLLVGASAGLSLPLLAIALLLPDRLRDAFARGFFPTGMPGAGRLARLTIITADARTGALVCLLALLVSALVLAGRLRPHHGVGVLVTLLALDLLRTGAWLNPTTDPRMIEPSLEIRAEVERIRRAGRLFSCDFEASPSWRRFLESHEGRHVNVGFATFADTLSPSTNVSVRVRTALTPDLTMLVPTTRTLPWQAARCRDVPALVGRLRDAGVGTVIALDPLEAPGLRWTHAVAPSRISPMMIHFHEVTSPRPRFEVLARDVESTVAAGSAFAVVDEPGWIEARVEAETAARLVVAEGPSRGWTATVDGRSEDIAVRGDRMMEMPVPPGTSTVRLRYTPPGLWSALGFALLVAAALGCHEWKRRFRPLNAQAESERGEIGQPV